MRNVWYSMAAVLAACSCSSAPDSPSRAESVADASTPIAPILASVLPTEATPTTTDPRARYSALLDRTIGPDHPLRQAWAARAQEALAQPEPLALPSRWAVDLPQFAPHAVAFTFASERGQRLVVELEGLEDDAVAPLFSLYVRTTGDDPDAPSPARPIVLDAADGEPSLRHVFAQTGEFVLLAQPKLGDGGRFVASAWLEPSLGFPVEGKDRKAVQSFFGAPRSGGKRTHHGIDIFANAGTHAVAVSDGRVVYVGTNKLGGNIVFVRDDAGDQAYYYAHLLEPLVTRGQVVSPGDPVGKVGNTGNARYGKPHLHFGIYDRGPIDPLAWVVRPRGRERPLRVELEQLGRWMQVRSRRSALYDQPTGRRTKVVTVTRNTPVRTIEGRDNAWRVELADGTRGWLLARKLSAFTPSQASAQVLVAPTILRSAPRPGAPPLGQLAPAAVVSRLTEHAGFMLVETDDRRRGWIAAPSAGS